MLWGLIGAAWPWLPPVGISIALLGLLGVIVPLIRDLQKIRRREKSIWTLVFFVLLLAEIKAVYQDRNEHDREQREVRERSEQNFQNIAQGIRDSIKQSDDHFKTTLQQGETQFRKITRQQTKEIQHTVTLLESNARLEKTTVQLSENFQHIDREVNAVLAGNPSAKALIKVTGELSGSLRLFPYAWRDSVHQVDLQRDEVFQYHQPPLSNKEEIDAINRSLQEQLANANAARRREIILLLADSETLITTLLSLIPPEKQTPEDKKKHDEISEIRQDRTNWEASSCCTDRLMRLADYLDALAARIARGE
jgi:hypothetical protein